MGWFFLLKRAAGFLAQPLTAVFLLLALGVLLAAFTERRRSAAVCAALAGALLFACSFPPLVRRQARPLERMHPPYSGGAGDVRAVVVLGSGVAHPGDGNLPALSRLNDTARMRLVEGVRLMRLHPEAGLFVCGYGTEVENCADAMAEAAVELGVPAGSVRRLAGGIDTENEAALAAEAAGGGRVLVVTTAVHMPRAMLYFRRAGVDAVAAPCGFIGAVDDVVRGAADRLNFRPGGPGLADCEEVWHEALGLLYLRISGGGAGLDR